MQDAKQIAAVFKALGDENRIKILKMLERGEKCAYALLEEMEISQPTLSHHMKILCDAGIVTGRKDGKWMHYRIAGEGVELAQAYMEQLAAVVSAYIQTDLKGSEQASAEGVKPSETEHVKQTGREEVQAERAARKKAEDSKVWLL